jgi:hypothetical protein
MDHFLAHVARGRADAARTGATHARLPHDDQTPVPLQVHREGWAKLGEILSGSTPATASTSRPFSDLDCAESEKTTSLQK